MDIVEISKQVGGLYTRTFESMGKDLFFIRVDNIHKDLFPDHYFFENGKKPPFDIAINHITRRISDFTFFFMNEKLIISDEPFSFEKINGEPVFSAELFDENKYHEFIQAEFDSFLWNESLVIIRKGSNPKKAIAISQDIAILMNEQNDFAGVLFESLSEQDIFKLKESEVID